MVGFKFQLIKVVVREINFINFKFAKLGFEYQLVKVIIQVCFTNFTFIKAVIKFKHPLTLVTSMAYFTFQFTFTKAIIIVVIKFMIQLIKGAKQISFINFISVDFIIKLLLIKKVIIQAYSTDFRAIRPIIMLDSQFITVIIIACFTSFICFTFIQYFVMPISRGWYQVVIKAVK